MGEAPIGRSASVAEFSNWNEFSYLDAREFPINLGLFDLNLRFVDLGEVCAFSPFSPGSGNPAFGLLFGSPTLRRQGVGAPAGYQ